ncbi:hypothetical protein [Acidithiobacillus ferrooxidans]|jgi:hypothetical protein|uniref:hypothetical protein n=1 Tax=Acidithiobacillus ferrooxidans TaxID=920 RepID=UPI000AE1B3A3|nr:hypothetical protein [Acidithiobacillus ferrooxidans]
MRYRHIPFPLPPSPPIRRWGDISPLFGNTFHLLDGRVVHRGEALPKDAGPVLPGVLRQRPAFCGDLIPVSAHGSSLYNLLTDKDWSAIRKPRIEAVHQVCQACGRRQYRYLQAHELWEYYLPGASPPGAGNQGIQRLRDIAILCKDCHAMFHLALADLQGHGDETMQRLMALHRWDTATAALFLDILHERRDRHNRFAWSLDLSIVDLDVLHIQPKWQEHPDLPGVLQRENEYRDGMQYTAILGKSWVINGSKEVHAAITSPLGQKDAA